MQLDINNILITDLHCKVKVLVRELNHYCKYVTL